LGEHVDVALMRSIIIVCGALQAVRERISALLCEEDKIDGLENVEVKVFK
jgi:hypothetical protein